MIILRPMTAGEEDFLLLPLLLHLRHSVITFNCLISPAMNYIGQDFHLYATRLPPPPPPPLSTPLIWANIQHAMMVVNLKRFVYQKQIFGCLSHAAIMKFSNGKNVPRLRCSFWPIYSLPFRLSDDTKTQKRRLLLTGSNYRPVVSYLKVSP